MIRLSRLSCLSCLLRFRHLIRCLTAAAFLALPTVAAEAAEGGAMIADLQGSVTRDGRPLDLLMEVAPGTVLTLADGASVTLLALVDGAETTVTGPGTATVGADGVTADGGAVAVSSMPAVASLSLRTDDYQQAAVVMRGAVGESVSGLAPDGGVVLAPPVLSWRQQTPKACAVTLRDDGGTDILETSTDAGYAVLPSDLALPPGTVVHWSLDCGQGEAREAVFAMADADLTARFTDARPEADAPFAHRVAYARALAAAGLEADAKRAFHHLAEERPDSLHLRVLGGLPLQGPIPAAP